MNDPLLVNDLHSQLNATRVARVIEPGGIEGLVATVRDARSAGAQLSLCGGRHAMGGQQFGTGTWLVDLRQHAAVRAFDQERGLLTVEAGIQWPALIEGEFLERKQAHDPTELFTSDWYRQHRKLFTDA